MISQSPAANQCPGSHGGCDAHHAVGLLTHTSGIHRPSLRVSPASSHRCNKDTGTTVPGSSQLGKECDYLEP